jgi:UrcA family protein
LTVATAALAEDAGGVRTTTVSFADLDLTKPADRDILQHRIDRAVDHLCFSGQPVRLIASRLEDICRRAALDGADRQLALIFGTGPNTAGGAITVVARTP